MTHVETAPHECEGNLIFAEHGLSPYWIIGKILTNSFDGDSGEIETKIDGELWTYSLTYQKGGFAPRSEDDVGGDRLYEFRLGAYGNGERKANFLIQPRFVDMQHYETGDEISTPFDHIHEDEGVNVRFSSSNLEPDELRRLLSLLVQDVSREADVHINPEYFGGSVNEMSNITTYERYVRVNRNWSQKIVGRAGIMQRLMHLCATEKGSKFEYRVDNEDIVGYNHRVILPKRDAQRLISGHRFGKQIKHYHPKHVRENNEGDPLYHPKVGVLLKKSLTGHSFNWSERDELKQEIDETLINVLDWSEVPVRPDQTTFVPDKHFSVNEAEKSVQRQSDPTPEMETNQEALLVTVLRDLCDSDVEMLESLVSDGGERHPRALADQTGRGISTVYRALERLQGIVRNDGASVSFASKKLEQEIAGIVQSTEHQIKNAADRAAKILNLETRQAASSAWQKWCEKYAARISETSDDGRPTVRIDTVLSELKSSSLPCVDEVLQEALDAWRSEGRDPLDLLEARVKWRTSPESWQGGKVSVNVPR